MRAEFAILLSVAGIVSVGCVRENKNSTANPLLIGGQLAKEGEFPSAVQWNGLCTASKIGPYHFLTAGHCVVQVFSTESGKPEVSYRLNIEHGRISVHNAVLRSEAKPVQSFVSRVVAHPSFIERTRVNPDNPAAITGSEVSTDLAVLVIDDETPDIPVIKVASAPPNIGEEVVLLGYGCEDPIVSVDHASEYKQRKKWGLSKVKELTDYIVSPFETVTNGQRVKLCPGDSGGSLYKKVGDNYEIVGVNSGFSNEKSLMARTDDKVNPSLTGNGITPYAWIQQQLTIAPRSEAQKPRNFPVKRYACNSIVPDPENSTLPAGTKYTFSLRGLGIRSQDKTVVELVDGLVLTSHKEFRSGNNPPAKADLEFPMERNLLNGNFELKAVMDLTAQKERHETSLELNPTDGTLRLWYSVCPTLGTPCDYEKVVFVSENVNLGKCTQVGN